MLNLSKFFGLVIEDDSSDYLSILEMLNERDFVEETKVVSTLKKQNGADAPIVSVGRRQQVLKLIKPLLNEDYLDFEENYYQKEINTSSEHDRRYGAEDKLLEFALLVATGKSMKVRLEEPKYISVKQLREAAFKGNRFEKCWDILSEETAHVVEAYRKSK